ncbi:MAG: helix-turn-helix domain-containing protein [Halobaculum sp.]
MAVSNTEGTTERDEAANPAAVAVPDDLSSSQSKLVYLYLATHRDVTETELCESLDMRRMALYSVLKTLRRAGLIEESGGTISLA